MYLLVAVSSVLGRLPPGELLQTDLSVMESASHIWTYLGSRSFAIRVEVQQAAKGHSHCQIAGHIGGFRYLACHGVACKQI